MLGLTSLQLGSRLILLVFMLEQPSIVMADQITVFVSWFILYALSSAEVYKVGCWNNYLRDMEG